MSTTPRLLGLIEVVSYFLSRRRRQIEPPPFSLGEIVTDGIIIGPVTRIDMSSCALWIGRPDGVDAIRPYSDTSDIYVRRATPHEIEHQCEHACLSHCPSCMARLLRGLNMCKKSASCILWDGHAGDCPELPY